MEERREDPTLPDLPLPYIIDWWREIGPVGVGGMGEAPISWQEIEAWQRLTGVRLDPWEALLVRTLSSEFIGQQHKARQPECPAPYIAGYDEPSKREIVSKKLKAAFGGLRAKPPTPKPTRKRKA